MKIYTRTGDAGETSLFGGERLPKDSLRIETYGTVDELNSLLGLCRSLNSRPEVDRLLEELQNDLFALGADLATPLSSGRKLRRIHASDAARLEKHIDSIEGVVEPLSRFILPGGTQAASLLHVARTVCRRAERLAVRLGRQEDIGSASLVYLNRLSDLLFMAARWVNSLAAQPEQFWDPGPGSGTAN